MLFIGDKPTLVGMRGLAGVPGVDYNCSSSICYGIGTLAHQQLMSVQTALNRFARSAGFSPLVVDGKIGDKTVSAVRATFAWVKSKGVEIDAAQAALTPEALTAAAIGPSGSGFAMMINALADKYKPATGSSGGGGSSSTTPVPTSTEDKTAPSSGKVPTWIYYAAAGVGGLGLLVTAYKLSARTVTSSRAPLAPGRRLSPRGV